MICNTILTPITVFITIFFTLVREILSTVCNWVSTVIEVIKEVVNKVCKKLPWPLSLLCKLVSKLISIFETIWKWVCEEVISFIVDLIEQIIVFILWVIKVICIILEFILRLPAFLLCLIGVSIPKRIIICIKVLTDERGNSLTSDTSIQNAIEIMKEIYGKCDIEIHIDSIERIVKPELLTETGSGTFGNFFAPWRVWFIRNACMCCNQITVFVVDEIKGKAEGVAYFGDNWCRVDKNIADDPTHIAHEVGHLLGLLHTDDPTNFMFKKANDDVNKKGITNLQCCMIKSSPYTVTAMRKKSNKTQK